MLELITLADARAHLRLDFEDDSNGGTGPDDPWLAIFIPAISEAVAGWVKSTARLYEPEIDSNGQPVIDSDDEPVPQLDSDGEYTVRYSVRAAVLLELSNAYRFREGEGKDSAVPADAGHGYTLNKASTALLTPLRRPTVR